MANNKPKEQPEPDMMIEIRNLKRIMAIFGAAVLFIGWQLFNADAQQDTAISAKPSYQLLAQYQKANESEHGAMTKSLFEMKASIKDNNAQIANIDSNLSEIKGFLEVFKEVLKEVVKKKKDDGK
jgi:preprotein translocase subunit SecA